MKNIVRVWIGDPYDGGHFNGTAFFIDKHTLVTAKHVVLNSKDEIYPNIFLSNMPDGGVTPVVEVVLCERDIAVLKVKQAFDIDEVLFSNGLKIDETVNIRGYYDKNSSQKSYENRVSGYLNESNTYELQNHLTHGLSGSPVFLDNTICGVTKAINSSKNLTYVIPIEALCVEIEMVKPEVDEEAIIKKLTLSPAQRIFNLFYAVAIPFSVIFAILYFVTSYLFPYTDFSQLVKSLLLISFVLANLFEFIRKKIKRGKS